MDGYIEDLESIAFANMIEKNTTAEGIDEVLELANRGIRKRDTDQTQGALDRRTRRIQA